MAQSAGSLDDRIRRYAMAHGISPDVAAAMLKSKMGTGILNQLANSVIEPAGGEMSAGNDMSVTLRQPNMNPSQPSYESGGNTVSGSGWGSSIRDWGTGIGNQLRDMVNIEPAGGPQEPNQGTAGSGGFGEYGGVPLGVRLATLGGILSNYGHFDPRMLSPLVAAREADAARKEQEKLAEQAERIASNIEDTNPAAAEAIRMDPSLVKDWMKGEMDLEKTLRVKEVENEYAIEDDTRDAKRELKLKYLERGWSEADAEKKAAADLALEGKKTEGDLAVEQLKIDNDPKRIAQKEWTETIKTFKTDTGLDKASTLDVYKTYTDDQELTSTEAKALASSKTEEEFWNRHNTIVDNRTKKKEVAAMSGSKVAADLVGVKLKEEQFLANSAEILAAAEAGLPLPEPILKWAKGSKGEAEAAAVESAADSKMTNQQKSAKNVIAAVDRALEGIGRQERGESATGLGITSILGQLPIATEAGNIYDDFQIIRANLGFDKLQEMRDQSPTGGALGPVSDYENRLLQSVQEVLNQGRDAATMKPRLLRIRNTYANIVNDFSTSSKSNPGQSVMKENIDLLLADPSPAARAEFDEVYGEGTAKAVLGQ